MIDTIIAIALGVMMSMFFLGIMSMFLEDTDTFQAIDEKIARWIRGKGGEEG